jgi:hypothetical protein
MVINTNIMSLDTIHRPDFIINATLSVDSTQLSRLYLKTVIESSLRNVVFEIETGL